jgi:hypothetical protein
MLQTALEGKGRGARKRNCEIVSQRKQRGSERAAKQTIGCFPAKYETYGGVLL